jgi:hypothetical protein
VGLRFLRESPATAEESTPIVVWGLLAGGFACCLAWIFVPVLGALWDWTLGPLQRAVQQRRERRSYERQQRRDELAHRQWEKQAAVQRSLERIVEEEQRSQERAAARKEDQERLRREEARKDCELLYALYASELGDRFSRAMFDAFLDKYLNDSQPAEAVERRAKELQQIIRQHLECVRPGPRTLTELTRWYEKQKREFEQLPDGPMRRSALAKLMRRYSDLSDELLEDMQP